jgi:hypothetical protein
MTKNAHIVRPTFTRAMADWQADLKQRGFSPDCTWLFDENLVFEPDAAAPGGFRLSYQVALTPPPQGGERISYEYLADFPSPLVFYRLGSSQGKSLCMILCDEWFASRGDQDGFTWEKESLIGHYPGKSQEIDEVTDVERWKKRLLKNRPLHDLDFCMPLRAVHEVLAHGRVLTTYEHYALRFLNAWRRIIP